MCYRDQTAHPNSEVNMANFILNSCRNFYIYIPYFILICYIIYHIKHIFCFITNLDSFNFSKIGDFFFKGRIKQLSKR